MNNSNPTSAPSSFRIHSSTHPENDDEDLCQAAEEVGALGEPPTERPVTPVEGATAEALSLLSVNSHTQEAPLNDHGYIRLTTPAGLPLTWNIHPSNEGSETEEVVAEQTPQAQGSETAKKKKKKKK